MNGRGRHVVHSHCDLEGERRSTAVAREDVLTADAILDLQVFDRVKDVVDVVWMSCVVCRVMLGFRIVAVRRQTVVDACVACDMSSAIFFEQRFLCLIEG